MIRALIILFIVYGCSSQERQHNRNRLNIGKCFYYRGSYGMVLSKSENLYMIYLEADEKYYQYNERIDFLKSRAIAMDCPNKLVENYKKRYPNQ